MTAINESHVNDYLSQLEEIQKVCLYNAWCESNNYMDDYIYSFDDEFFDEHFKSPLEAVRAWNFGHHYGCDASNAYNADYIRFNRLANLETIYSCNLDDMLEDIEEDWIIENYEDEIIEALDLYEEEEEEENEDE